VRHWRQACVIFPCSPRISARLADYAPWPVLKPAGDLPLLALDDDDGLRRSRGGEVRGGGERVDQSQERAGKLRARAFGLPAAQAGAAVDFWSAALGVAARLAPREQQFTVLSGAVGVF